MMKKKLLTAILAIITLFSVLGGVKFYSDNRSAEQVYAVEEAEPRDEETTEEDATMSSVETTEAFSDENYIGPSPRAVGNTLTSAGTRVIKGVLTDYSTWIPSDYYMRVKFSSSSTITPSGFAGTHYNATTTRRLQLPNGRQGTANVTYKNVGYYNGQALDIKVTLTDYIISVSSSGGQYGILQIHTDSMRMDWIGIYNVQLKYEFFKAGTTTPVDVKGTFTYGDIDYAEELVYPGFDASNWDQTYVHPNSQLKYGMHNTDLRFTGNGKDAQFESTPEAFSTGAFSGSSVIAGYENNGATPTLSWPWTSDMHFTFVMMETNVMPYQIPTITKSVSDSDETNVTTNYLDTQAETFEYKLRFSVPDESSDWYYKAFSVTDALPAGTILNGTASNIKVTNVNTGADVTSMFTPSVASSTNITVTGKAAYVSGSSAASFYSQTYEITIPVKVSDYSSLASHNTIFKKAENTAKINVTTFDSVARSNSSNTVTTYVPRYGTLVIQKTDKDTAAALAGATFQVKNTTLGTTVYTGTTPASGIITITDLPIGNKNGTYTYTITETSAPTGYNLSSPASQTATLTADATVTKTFANEKTSVGMTIYKRDADTNALLPGAVYKITDSSGVDIATGLTTNASGQISVPASTGLKVGQKYTIRETSAPTGYNLASPAYQTITMSDTAANNTVTFLNTRTSVGLIIRKRDADTNASLAGAVYSIKDSAGTTVASNLTTTSTGQVSVSATLGLKVGLTYTITETSAPTGYDLASPASQSFTLTATVTDNVVTFLNTKTSVGMTIYKRDADTNALLAGAVYSIKNSSGTTLASNLTTNASGQITVPASTGLKVGEKYTITETSAPTGYNLASSTSQTITLTDTAANNTVTFLNARTSVAMTIYKRDAESNSTIAGAVYSIKDSSGTILASNLTTSAFGYITVPASTGLKVGITYTITETSAPTGYELASPASQTITLTDTAANNIVTFLNTRSSVGMTIYKRDKDTNALLAGAVYSIKETSSGTIIASNLTTNASGQITIPASVGLEFGKLYTVTETSAPTGYNLASPAYQFITMKATAADNTLTFYNERTSIAMTIYKRDADTNALLSGAVYSVKDSSGTTVASNLTTTGGQITVPASTGLKVGLTYTITETSAPTGYDLATPVSQSLTLTNTAANNIVTFLNTKTSVGMTIYKRDKDTNALLAGAVYSIKNSSGTTLASGLTTNAAGQITVPASTGLKVGEKYTITETSAPTGYDLASPASQTITLTDTATNNVVTFLNTKTSVGMTIYKRDKDSNALLAGAVYSITDSSGTTLASGLTTNTSGQIAVPASTDLKVGETYTITETSAPTGYDLANPASQTITVTDTAANNVVTFLNTRSSVGMTIYKRDKDTNVLLAGAVYSIKETTSGTTIVSNLTTDASGQITVPASVGLKVGIRYTVTETSAPTGYSLVSPAYQYITLQASATDNTLTFYNVKSSIPMSIYKRDADTNALLAGAVYSIEDSSGNTLASNLTTNAYGYFTVQVSLGLKVGETYTITETSAPAGYDLANPASQKITLTDKASNNTVTFLNTKTSVGMTIYKRDKDTNALLAGAVYSIKNSSGTTLASGLTTNATGQITVPASTGLKVGETYTVTETAAPTGYQLAASVSQPITLTDTAASNVLTFYNEKAEGGLEIIKVDSEDNDIKLGGAVFDIATDAAGTTIIHTGLITNSSGSISIPGMTAGTYYVRETQAPDGYHITDSSWVKVTVTAGTTTKITFENTPTRLHIRQVIVQPHNDLVIPSSGYFNLEQIDGANTIIHSYQLISGSTTKDTAAEVNQSLFTTVRITVNQDTLTVTDIVPEYYTFFGAIVTDTATNLNTKHLSSNTADLLNSQPLSLDYSQASEYWVTVFITPKMGSDSDGKEEPDPRPYSWDTVTNELGQLTK